MWSSTLDRRLAHKFASTLLLSELSASTAANELVIVPMALTFKPSNNNTNISVRYVSKMESKYGPHHIHCYRYSMWSNK